MGVADRETGMSGFTRYPGVRLAMAQLWANMFSEHVRLPLPNNNRGVFIPPVVRLEKSLIRG